MEFTVKKPARVECLDVGNELFEKYAFIYRPVFLR